MTLNASAYIAEIVRGGINAVPKGQMEASRSLGMTYTRTMQKIILPQAIKIMIPSFVNQFVISLKDTTIISVIRVVELCKLGKSSLLGLRKVPMFTDHRDYLLSRDHSFNETCKVLKKVK